MRGRFAPSPTGSLHFGNLRTALAAYLWAKSAGGEFVIRMEDLDQHTSSRDIGEQQLHDLELLGIKSDIEVVWQSERFEIYNSVIENLTALGMTYPCYCSRREIREAAQAPHGVMHDGIYPGTCRDLTDRERNERASTRPPAIRLRSDISELTITDSLFGDYTGPVDDVVLRRNDGVPAYNLAVVVDDAIQHITQVCRGDDLLSSTPRQVYLQRLLGFPTPNYLHIPLVMGDDGERLSKRNGAKSIAEFLQSGWNIEQLLTELVRSLDAEAGFDPIKVNKVGKWTI